MTQYQQGFQSHLGNALDAVSGDLGTVANYAAERDKQQQDQAFQAQQNAAREQFQAALTARQMDMEENHFTRKEQGDDQDKAAALAFRQKELDATTAYRDKALDEQSGFHNASLGLESKRVGLEADRVGVEKDRLTASHTDAVNARKAASEGAQIATTMRTRTATQAQMDREMKSAAANSLIDPDKSAAAQAAITKKYAPIFAQLDQKQARHEANFAKLQGEEYNPDAVATPDANPDGTPIAGLPTEADAAGNDPTMGSGAQASGAATTPSPSAPAGPQPSPDSIKQLRANPSMRDQFDAYYGAGASDKYLTGY